MELTRLFSPITINKLEIKNRIVMPALHHLYTPDGKATERFNAYYWRRAEGGAGLVMVGGCKFDDVGGSNMMMSLASDEFIPGYKEFTDGMHARGAKVGVQLFHAGRYSKADTLPDGLEALAPSSVYSGYSKSTPKEMTKADIEDIIAKWAAAAVRAQKAGFDVVEIVGSAGYLVTQFLSPLTNLRTDEYGGSFENRTRFARELVAAVRKAVGPDYTLCMRIAGNDFVPGSNTNSESVAFCKEMEKSGIDLLNVTGGWHESPVPQITGDLPRGGYVYLVSAIKDAVNVPVAASNRINDPLLAERILALGEADMVSIGRPLIADPDWANKAQEGRIREIRRCMACNQGCLAKTFFGKPIECLVNGTAGREYLVQQAAPAQPKSILVVGAGPAGCEFAITAAERGHKVTIWEKDNTIGGQLSMVATPPGKSEFLTLIDYYDALLEKNGVEVVLNKEATAKEIATAGFDVIVTATGIVPNSIPLKNEHNIPVMSAYDILQQKAIAGRQVVVIGGGTVGCEVAQYLAHEASLSPEQLYFLLEHKAETVDKVLEMLNSTRRDIAIVDIAKIGAGFEPGTAWPVMKDLKRLGVKQFSFAQIDAITADSIQVSGTDKKTGEAFSATLPCDTIVLSVGAKPNNALFDELNALGLTVYNLGDSDKIGKVLDAVRDADALAVKV